jgi:hypothetical protein
VLQLGQTHSAHCQFHRDTWSLYLILGLAQTTAALGVFRVSPQIF